MTDCSASYHCKSAITRFLMLLKTCWSKILGERDFRSFWRVHSPPPPKRCLNKTLITRLHGVCYHTNVSAKTITHLCHFHDVIPRVRKLRVKILPVAAALFHCTRARRSAVKTVFGYMRGYLTMSLSITESDFAYVKSAPFHG